MWQLTDLNVFRGYNLAISLIFAVLELRLIQHEMNCGQFCLFNVVIFGPHSMRRVQRCGLLLPMFRGLCVCLSVGPNRELR